MPTPLSRPAALTKCQRSSSDSNPRVNNVTNDSSVVMTSNHNANNNTSLLSGLNVSQLAEELNALGGASESCAINKMMMNDSSLTSTSGFVPTTSTTVAPSNSASGNLIPERPRRLWAVSDTKVPTYPAFYPLPCTQTSCTIRSPPDAPPSVIAIRIAECLLARSVQAEYDEEAVTATCLTIDRCLFTVHLWRWNHPGSGESVILVECVRTTGNVVTFHRTAHAILQAAQSLDSGKDTRSVVQSSPSEYPRFLSTQPAKLSPDPLHFSGASGSSVASALTSNTHASSSTKYSSKILLLPAVKPSVIQAQVTAALEHILHEQLRKDRLGPQQTGMEQLVSLTDPVSVGLDVALHAALCVLGRAPLPDVASSVASASSDCGAVFDDIGNVVEELHKDWIMGLLLFRQLPVERSNFEAANPSSTSFSALSCATSLIGTRMNEAGQDQNQQQEQDAGTLDDTYPGQHGGKMRSLTLRAICNSLDILAKHQKIVLESILAVQSPIWTSDAVVSALVEDIQQGASRPVQAVCQTRLASQHEAAVACRILGLLCQHNTALKRRLAAQHTIQSKSSGSKGVLDHLEYARVVGKSTHRILAEESHRCYQILTEDERSC